MGHKYVGLWLWNHLPKREEKCCCRFTLKKVWGCGSIVLCYFYYPTILDKWKKDEWKKDEEVWPLIQKLQKILAQKILLELNEEGKIILEPRVVIETRTRQATKSINLRVSYQLEELTCWRFHMGGQEFYTEASRTTQALRTTLFEGEGHVRSLYY